MNRGLLDENGLAELARRLPQRQRVLLRLVDAAAEAGSDARRAFAKRMLDLTLGVQPFAPDDFAEGAVKANMIATFSRWPVTIVYVIAMCFLFLHLTHGIRLAASDLGITGAKWRQTFLILAYVIPAVVCIGNIVMPLSVALGLVS